jgi:orotate phosphoribosyltransferase-like protein
MAKKANKKERWTRIRHVMRLKFSGQTNEEIANELNLNPKTVKIYLDRGFNISEDALKEYCINYVKELKKEKDALNERLYSKFFKCEDPKEMAALAKGIMDNKKFEFDVLSKTGKIGIVADKLEIKQDIDDNMIKEMLNSIKKGKESKQKEE